MTFSIEVLEVITPKAIKLSFTFIYLAGKTHIFIRFHRVNSQTDLIFTELT